ncbi:hypothetical protein EDB89DRAFT_1908778 [Lactarius sanguifluus]|nr:hypothetical protein EDB89DRAFT_1908778 [Lactarius sanguifluus]
MCLRQPQQVVVRSGGHHLWLHKRMVLGCGGIDGIDGENGGICVGVDIIDGDILVIIGVVVIVVGIDSIVIVVGEINGIIGVVVVVGEIDGIVGVGILGIHCIIWGKEEKGSQEGDGGIGVAPRMVLGRRGVGIARGNLGVFQGYPYLYPNIPVPATGVQVSMGQAICTYKQVLGEWDKGLAGQAANLLDPGGNVERIKQSEVEIKLANITKQTVVHGKLRVKAPNGGTAYALEVHKALRNGWGATSVSWSHGAASISMGHSAAWVSKGHDTVWVSMGHDATSIRRVGVNRPWHHCHGAASVSKGQDAAWALMGHGAVSIRFIGVNGPQRRVNTPCRCRWATAPCRYTSSVSMGHGAVSIHHVGVGGPRHCVSVKGPQRRMGIDGPRCRVDTLCHCHSAMAPRVENHGAAWVSRSHSAAQRGGA